MVYLATGRPCDRFGRSVYTWTLLSALVGRAVEGPEVGEIELLELVVCLTEVNWEADVLYIGFE
jgi:hypothetical protein